MNEVITSPSNSIIKEVKSLHRKKDRWKYKKFFLEGIRSVKEIITSNNRIDYVLYSEELFKINGGEELYNSLLNNNIRIIETTNKILKSISDTDNPQGIISVVNFNNHNLNEFVSNNNFILILDRIQDPGNMGTIIRTADAFGVDYIIVSEGCVDVYNPKTIRSTMGSIFHVPIIFSDDLSSTIQDIKKNNIIVMSTSLKNSNNCNNLDLTRGLALVIGNEANGVSKDIIGMSDETIKIPMVGDAESLNAAVASGILIYEVNRQRLKI